MADHVKVLRGWLRQVQGRLDYHAGRSPHGSNPSTVAERDALTAAISAMTESDRLAAAHNEELRSAAAEVAERDARIEGLKAQYVALMNMYTQQRLNEQKLLRRAEAAEARIAELEANLRKLSPLNYEERCRLRDAEARVRELEALLKQCVPYVIDGGHQQYADGCSNYGDKDFAFAKHIESILSQRS